MIFANDYLNWGGKMHWYIVASQKEARIFIKTSDTKQLKLLKTLTNPLGSEKKSTLIKKQAGKGVKTIGNTGTIHYSNLKRLDPHEEAIIQFAKSVSKFLEEKKVKKSFDSLTIVAEPHLLGRLKSEMSNDLLSTVSSWLKKDLQKTPNLLEHLT